MLPTGPIPGPSSASLSSGRACYCLQFVVAAIPGGPWRNWNTVYDNARRERHKPLGSYPMAGPGQSRYPAGREITCWTRRHTVIEPLTGTTEHAA
jgi:hypothetical protein